MSCPKTSFEQKIATQFSCVAPCHRSEVRWWMAAGTHTDETIKEEIRAMHDAGFSGVELCQLADKTIQEEIYGYGSAQWENDVKLILNTALDLGMSVSLTSGAGWSTANVPGLDPDSQQANQCVVLLTEELAAGGVRSGLLPTDQRLREKAKFIGAVAVQKVAEQVYSSENFHILTPLVVDGTLQWSAPKDGDYTIMYYFAQGTAQGISPAVKRAYTINYFDRRGFEALREYLEQNVLNDEEIKGKIKAGDVQFFMDSLEYTCGEGFTSWTETFAEEFQNRKGYDILPYLYLAKDAPDTSIWGWSDNADLQGIYTLTDPRLATKILNDIYDVQTKLYVEEFINPFRAWLHTHGITLRVQISYGKNLEISEPIAAVDYPEAENRNQKNQVDMYRLWSGGSHLQNKMLSSETGGLANSAYNYTYQKNLQEAYDLYAAGYSRMIWHIWASNYGPVPVWPGYEGGDRKEVYYKFGKREPSFTEYSEFNDHLGRIQKLLRQGTAGVDLGMLYTKYGQHLVYTDPEDWMHTHRPMFFPSTALQDNGYTYDYLSPDLLTADGVFFDQASKTLELAGYKALVLWQRDLSVCGAEKILALAKQGLPLVIVDGAAVDSPYQGDEKEALFDLVSELKALKNVVSVSDADGVLGALKSMGISPYAGFRAPNQQLLTQTRRDGNDRYLFAYNYCDGSLHTAENVPHGDRIKTELAADGIFVPYVIDAWNGKVQKIAAYRHQDGKTFFEISLNYGDVALFALQSAEQEELHVDACAGVYESDGKFLYKATESGEYSFPLNTGATVKGMGRAEAPYEITGWDLTVESWTPTDLLETRTETLLGVTTNEYAYKTEKTEINVTLDTLTPWDKIDGVGKNVSGKGYYRATFPWKGTADGAYLDFGKLTQSMKVFINGKKTDDVNMNRPTVDISSLLHTGENVIEIQYSSNLNNLQLSRGVIREGVLPSNFLGYDVKYESYGPQKATVVPYTVIELA